MTDFFGADSTPDDVLRNVHLRGRRVLFTGTSADVLIPVIRAAATIGFAVVPCSLGFVLIAVSEQLIRAIMVGEDPELLVGNLQQQFPHEALKVEENHDPVWVASVVELVERRAYANTDSSARCEPTAIGECHTLECLSELSACNTG